MKNPKIAWIEDDINIIDEVIEPLVRSKYEVLKYFTPKEALNDLKNLKQADVILVDMITEPFSNKKDSPYPGKDFIEHLLKEHKIKASIIAFTIVRSENLIKRLKEIGVAEIIQKPILPSELKKIIDEIVMCKSQKASEPDSTR